MTFAEASRTASADTDRHATTGWFDFLSLGIEHILIDAYPAAFR